MSLLEPIKTCLCCGSDRIVLAPVLWESLINEWRISNYEIDYINRQQGIHCLNCYNNLRSMVLAMAVMRCFNYKGLFKDFVKEKSIQSLEILGINESGNLTSFLKQVTGHILGNYPTVDMMFLPFADATFDLVIHSDTLEHTEYPIRALSECCRVLKTDGFCAFTIPMIVDRLTISREGYPPSYHSSEQDRSDFLVHTEYGCDAWKHIMLAGFQECRIFSIEYPSAQALVGVK